MSQALDTARSELAAAGLSNETRRLVNAALNIAHALANEKHGPFICGHADSTDSMGLPEVLLVCPQFGLDGSARYRKDGAYSAPGW